MKWNFNGYVSMTSTPRQSIVNREPPNPPTSGSNAQKKTQKHACVVLVLLGLLVFTTVSENGNTALIVGQNCKRRKIKNE